MNVNLSLTAIRKTLTNFLERFHVVIFVVVILGGLTIVILLLNNVILTSSEAGDYVPDSNSASFDQATIDRIEQLKTRDEASDQLDLSHGRTNPFAE